MSENIIKTIVSIPGGGVRGIVSAINIKRLSDTGKLDLDKVSMFSGASTGAIIAAALAKPHPYSPPDIVELYQDLAPKVFKLPWYKAKWAMRLLYGAPYDINKLRDRLDFYFKRVRLGDVQKNICITTLSLDELVPYTNKYGEKTHQRAAKTLFLSNTHPPHEKWLNAPLADVIAASCAAPGYFWPHRFRLQTGPREKQGHWVKCIDGGLSDNTSMLGAIATLQNQDKESLKDTEIIYFGNGGRKWCGDAAYKPTNKWEVPRLVNTLAKLIVPSNETLVKQYVKSALNGRLKVVEPISNDEIGLDEYERIPELIDISKREDCYAI